MSGVYINVFEITSASLLIYMHALFCIFISYISYVVFVSYIFVLMYLFLVFVLMFCEFKNMFPVICLPRMRFLRRV